MTTTTRPALIVAVDDFDGEDDELAFTGSSSNTMLTLIALGSLLVGVLLVFVSHLKRTYGRLWVKR